ncbi:MAG: energy transducer TonB [Betaproteobacteria bacterium]
MEHDSGRSRMGFAILASLLVHAAVILFVPVASLNGVVIYPVEFGEIEQAFEAPRAGSPEGDASVAVQPEAEKSSEAARTTGTETHVTVKPAPKPAAKPTSTPRQAAQPKPAPEAPAKPAQAPAPAPISAAQTKRAATSPTGSQSPPSEQAPTVSPKPATTGASAAEGTSGSAAGEAAAAGENVLTGKSDEVVPVPAAASAASAGGGASASNAVPATAAAGMNAGESAGSEGEAGSATVGRVDAEGTGGPDAGGGPAKPKGEEFGTGRSLVLSGVPPVYPKNAQNEGVEGSVQLSVSVDALGNATKVAVTAGSGDARLDDAAIRTISRGWRFQAIGWPYELSVRVTFRKTSVELAFGGVTVLGD